MQRQKNIGFDEYDNFLYFSKFYVHAFVKKLMNINHNYRYYFLFLETFKRGKEKCSQALIMSDINTNSDINANKTTKKSSPIIDPFPSINCDDVGPSGNDSETEKSDRSTLKSHTKIRKNQISSINEQSNNLSLTQQSSLTHNCKEQTNLLKKIFVIISFFLNYIFIVFIDENCNRTIL